jgi:hypothetical protein
MAAYWIGNLCTRHVMLWKLLQWRSLKGIDGGLAIEFAKGFQSLFLRSLLRSTSLLLLQGAAIVIN